MSQNEFTDPGIQNISEPDQSPTSKPKTTLAGLLGTQLLGLLVFVGLPAFVTGIAPVSWVTFERHDDQVTATAKTCLFFFIPYKTVTVNPVTGVGDRFAAGTVTHERREGRDHDAKSEDEGFLVIHGNKQAAQVPVTPFNLKSVLEKSEAFLRDPQGTELRLFVVANWKFSVIVGGLISLLTVLYAIGVASSAGVKFIHLFQWALGIPPEERLFVSQAKRSS